MGTQKLNAQFSARIDSAALEKFVANAEACKSTKDIVLRELVYAFNRYCEDGRFPVLQRLEISSPGYMVNEDGSVRDATPGVMMLPEPGSYDHRSTADALSRSAGDLLAKASKAAATRKPTRAAHK